MDWICIPTWQRNGISMVWRAILHTFPTIINELAWRINDGSSVCFGLDPWFGCGNIFRLPPDLIQFLNNRNIYVISHVVDMENRTIFNQAWFSTEQLDIPAHWKYDWEAYTAALNESHICIKEGADDLLWTPVKHGTYSLKAGYLIIHSRNRPLVLKDWWIKIWKLKAPLRTKLFIWNVIQNKTPTGYNLMQRSFFGPT